MTAHRRRFLESAAVAGMAAFAGLRPLQAAADAEVEIDSSQPGPRISPHLYGHFIEHLGGVIYDGIWVGRESKVPNVGGIRRQFVDDLKGLGAPNLRWPGGCFADGYHWRDGIGGGLQRAEAGEGGHSGHGRRLEEPASVGSHGLAALYSHTI